MLRLQIGETIENNPKIAKDLILYIISSGRTCLYVGRSRHPIDRLYSHISIRGRSHIGQAIHDHWPNSKYWELLLLTFEDCEEITGYDFSNYYTVDYEKYKLAMVLAEEALIRKYNPILNITRVKIFDSLIETITPKATNK